MTTQPNFLHVRQQALQAPTCRRQQPSLGKHCRVFSCCLVCVIGCGGPPAATTDPSKADSTHRSSKVEDQTPSKSETKTASRPVDVGRSVAVEVLPTGERRVLINAVVSLRKGPLELFMCRKFTKEHESIVSGDFDARDIHAALLMAKAVPGAPAKFEPKYVPASGTPIKVSVRYSHQGKETTTDARQWIRDVKTQKEMAANWVFTGSQFFPDPNDAKKQLYAANGGDVICLSNFGMAMLDLPIESSAVNEDLRFEAWTDRIPDLGTKVTVILEPTK